MRFISSILTRLPKHPQQGNSLIIMAIIMLVVGAFLISQQVGGSGIDVANNQLTANTLINIRNAIVSFKGMNGRLPCPAPRAANKGMASFGVEQYPCNTPASYPTLGITIDSTNVALFGAVPFVTLNLTEQQSYDAWGNKILYAMPMGMGSTTTYSATTPPFTVNQASGAPAITSQEMVLVSHGRTGMGAYNFNSTTISYTCTAGSADYENCNDDLTFYLGIQNPTPGATFYDDVMQNYSAF